MLWWPGILCFLLQVSWRQFSLRFASLNISTLFLECLETGAGEESLTSFHVSRRWHRHLLACQHEVRELFLQVFIFLLSYVLIIISLTTTILSLSPPYVTDTALCCDVRTLTHSHSGLSNHNGLILSQMHTALQCK